MAFVALGAFFILFFQTDRELRQVRRTPLNEGVAHSTMCPAFSPADAGWGVGPILSQAAGCRPGAPCRCRCLHKSNGRVPLDCLAKFPTKH